MWKTFGLIVDYIGVTTKLDGALATYRSRMAFSTFFLSSGWHLKDQLRRELRSRVRYRAHQAGFDGADRVKDVAARVECYAEATRPRHPERLRRLAPLSPGVA